jgi:hypothetical protein
MDFGKIVSYFNKKISFSIPGNIKNEPKIYSFRDYIALFSEEPVKAFAVRERRFVPVSVREPVPLTRV